MVDTRCVRTRQKGLRNANQWTVDWAYMIGLGLQGRGLVVGALASCTGCVKHVVRQPQKIKKKKRPRKPWTRYKQKTRMTKKNKDTKTRQRKTWQKSLEQRTPDTHGKTDTQHKRDKNKRSIAGKKTHTHTKGRDSKHWRKKKEAKGLPPFPHLRRRVLLCSPHMNVHSAHTNTPKTQDGQTSGKWPNTKHSNNGIHTRHPRKQSPKHYQVRTCAPNCTHLAEWCTRHAWTCAPPEHPPASSPDTNRKHKTTTTKTGRKTPRPFGVVGWRNNWQTLVYEHYSLLILVVQAPQESRTVHKKCSSTYVNDEWSFLPFHCTA